MTNQEAFDKVCKHLLRPNFVQSTFNADGTGQCAYAGTNGNSCAVGCLLPRHIGEQLDTLPYSGWDAIVDHGTAPPFVNEAVAYLDGVNPQLLEGLQIIHDLHLLGLSKEEHRAERLRRLQLEAHEYGLTMPSTAV